VYRYARRRLPTDDAEDVSQEAFEALFRAEAKGRAPDDPGAYLLGCARRRIADRLRRHLRRPPPVALPPQWEAFDAEPLPAEALAAAELRDLVHVALGLMPAAAARLLHARYRSGRSVGDIAETLRITPKAAEARLRRARGLFRRNFLQVGRDWTHRGPDDPPTEGVTAGEVTP
jgi:RNA polymerase sigma factor (sigma-70 family)